MNKPLFYCLLLLFCGQGLRAEVDLDAAFATEDVERYIKRFKEIAIREMERTGVPASIKLAQGILESGAGKSDLARNAKNHFGIKCGSQWKGDEYYKKDDDYDENGRLIKSCFRQYRNADASFVAHSEFLRDPAKSFRYGFLFRLEPTDYQSWAKGLRQAGYATNPRYPELLISLIERHNLYQYDRPGAVDPEEVEVPIEEAITGILQTNDVTYFISDAPITVQEVARQVDVSVRRLLDYNEGLVKESDEVGVGDRVYLQPKRSSYRGRERFHTVEAGENLFDVAQRYGLKLDKLAKRNRLAEDSDPATGTKIKLRGSKVKEAPREEGTQDPNAPIINLPTGTDGNLDVEDPTDEPTTEQPTTTPPLPNGPGVIRPGGNPAPAPPPTTTNPTTPSPGANPVPSSPTTPTTTPVTNRQYHNVVAGETLYGISRRYGLTVPQLKELNQLTSNSIFIGQQLRVK
ncbi:MAG: glucosaminidase domain-containing protein [Bacteroidota bacterium]